LASGPLSETRLPVAGIVNDDDRDAIAELAATAVPAAVIVRVGVERFRHY